MPEIPEIHSISQQRAPVALIVDHLNPFSQSIRPTLERRGFTVFCARSPHRALELFKASRSTVDIVVIDMETPGAGILDLSADLVRQRPSLPILYLVGAGRTIARCSIEARSPNSVLAAPFTEEQVLERINGLLNMEAATLPGPEEELWEQLAAASNPIPSEAAILYMYEFQQAGLAARHVDMLLEGHIQHAFKRTNCEAAPFGMIVLAKDATRARTVIARASQGTRFVSAA